MNVNEEQAVGQDQEAVLEQEEDQAHEPAFGALRSVQDTLQAFHAREPVEQFESEPEELLPEASEEVAMANLPVDSLSGVVVDGAPAQVAPIAIYQDIYQRLNNDTGLDMSTT